MARWKPARVAGQLTVSVYESVTVSSQLYHRFYLLHKHTVDCSCYSASPSFDEMYIMTFGPMIIAFNAADAAVSVKPCPYWRLQSPNLATVAKFGDYSLQCGHGFTMVLCPANKVVVYPRVTVHAVRASVGKKWNKSPLCVCLFV